MKPELKIELSGMEEFLAHALALKYESEERLEQLAHCLAEHNNQAAADVFQGLIDSIGSVIRELEALAADRYLPQIPPWEYQWHCDDDPEALCIDQAHYLMTARQSLELARFNELRSLQFFQKVKDEVADDQIASLAQRLIEIELAFADDIQQRLESLPQDSPPCEDLDPPNMPE